MMYALWSRSSASGPSYLRCAHTDLDHLVGHALYYFDHWEIFSEDGACVKSSKDFADPQTACDEDDHATAAEHRRESNARIIAALGLHSKAPTRRPRNRYLSENVIEFPRRG